ncbi:MAG TPA: nickel pincer cofactor biosynthesis protein LarB [Pyrinomonadaceae bacterium]|nr:nickel pincer cofactor biosynthesis protein LarB [Pyrinomonadaceae bacterium]
MDKEFLNELLAQVAAGEVSPDQALEKLRWQPVESISDFARLDHHRALRQSMPEFVYAEGKSPVQVASIMSAMVERTGTALATRVTQAHFEAVRAVLPEVVHNNVARTLSANSFPIAEIGRALVIAAGTSDVPVAEEAAEVLRFLGDSTRTLYDVGVAGIHRLLEQASYLQEADVLIVVAGMEGALPSVVGGLVDSPVIAVPTSVGYGASLQGLAALLGMLNSCATGLTVVNIDNGLGAATAAHRLLTRMRIAATGRVELSGQAVVR